MDKLKAELSDYRKESLREPEERTKALGRLQRSVIGYIKYLTGDVTIACDIAQETLTKAMPAIKESQRPEGLKAYLLKIARNLLVDEYRKFGSRIELSEPIDIDRGAGMERQRENSDPELVLIEKESSRNIVAHFESLKPVYKEIIALHYYNDLTLGEIASLLGIPLNTAITRLCRARKALKLRLVKENYHGMS